MTMLYVSNLSSQTTEDDLVNLFNQVGLVLTVSIPMSPGSRNPDKFGFVSMTPEGAEAAITALHGTVFQERTISVTQTDKTA